MRAPAFENSKPSTASVCGKTTASVCGKTTAHPIASTRRRDLRIDCSGVARVIQRGNPGGSGTGPDFDGASALQIHMTNSRLTDPEVLELRFPVRVDEFSIRRSSGKHKGSRGFGTA